MRASLPSAARLLLCLALAVPGTAQEAAAPLPFAPGETLHYRAVSARIGSFGTGSMRVEGPEEVRGQHTYRLAFEFRGRIGPLGVRDETHSWLAPERMLSLRYHKRQRSPLGSHDEEVEIFPSEQRWTAASGRKGPTPTLVPLDELSFLYYIRILPLREGEVLSPSRHFDSERNPVLIRVLRRERIQVPAGEFATVVVEMRVQDRRVFGGTGALVLYLSDDARRIPVRVESSFPIVGTTRLLLLAEP